MPEGKKEKVAEILIFDEGFMMVTNDEEQARALQELYRKAMEG